ncbi:MAG: SpoIIE family protein phosphatase [Candidatus Ozemobacteraceae bacterium]
MNPLAWLLEGRVMTELRGPLRFVIFCLVIFGIPLGLGSVAQKEIRRVRKQDQIEFRKSELESRVGLFNQWIPDLSSFDRVFLVEWQQICRKLNPQEAFADWRSLLRKWFRGAIAMEFIDQHGKRVPRLSDNVLSDTLLHRLHHDSDKKEVVHAQKTLEKNLDYYRRELGPLLGRYSGKILNRMESLDIHARWIAICITEALLPGQAVFLFRESRYWPEMISSFRLELLRRSHPDMAFAGIDLRLPMASQVRSLGSAGKWLTELLRDPEANGGAPVVKGAWVMAQVPISRHFRAIFALPLYPVGAKREQEDGTRTLALVVVFFLLSEFGRRCFFSFAQPFVSLRWKIGLLLLYVVGVPLGLLGLAAGNSLREYRSLLEKRLWNRQERAIREFENGFLVSQGRMEALIHNDLERVASDTQYLDSDLLRRVDRLYNLFKPQFCEVLNEKGKPLTKAYLGDGGNFKPLLEMMQSFSSRILADLNQGRGRSVSTKEQLMTATGEMLGVNIDLMYAAINRYLGEITPVKIGPDLFQIFLQPIFNISRTAHHIVVMVWSDNIAPLNYIQNIGIPIRDRSGEIELWVEYGVKSVFLEADMPFQKKVLRLLPRIRSELRPIRWKMSASEKMALVGISDEELLGEAGILSPPQMSSEKSPDNPSEEPASVTELLQQGRTFLCTAQKGLSIDNFVLIAISNDKRIQAELDVLLQRFGMVALVFLGMALAASRLLAARFLVPVRHLAVGVKAIQERTFSHRIPIQHDDELGRLSETFNEMIEGLKDLEIARVVQENYFPAVLLERGGWTISGSCQAAGRVGGDYLDFFPIGEKRVGMVIGDVSGHGVGAALVVSMAKALIASPSMVLEPAALLERMQRVFAVTLKRKKIMSCFVVMFEPESGRMWSANAGHNFPYLIRADGRVEQIKTGGKPLGTKNKPFTVQEGRLEADDWLFLYTDGFIEAFHVNGGDIGYDRVEAALPGLRRSDAKETETALRDWFASQAAPGPQADDISILVLRRKQ